MEITNTVNEIKAVSQHSGLLCEQTVPNNARQLERLCI